jgi:DNA-binding transcriptional ArsR family regulator
MTPDAPQPTGRPRGGSEVASVREIPLVEATPLQPAARRADDVYYIERLDQLELLASALRQEILDSLAAEGPASTTELARALGVGADTVYYHVRKLLAADLLVVARHRETGRRPEVEYGLPARILTMRYPAKDRVRKALVGKVVAAALRTGIRDFTRAAGASDVVTEGPRRNLWGGRCKAWLSPEQIEEVGTHLLRLRELFNTGTSPAQGQLCSFAFALAPLRPRPTGRPE